MLRFAAVWLFVVAIPLIAEAQEPPKLQPVFSDDFSKDTRSDYKIDGNVTWEKGGLTLAEGASIERAIDGGAWAKVELRFEPSKLSKEQPQSELRVWFILEGATNCYVRLRNSLTGDRAGSVALVDTGEKDGKAIEQVVRQADLQGHDFGRLSVEYRNGLVRVTADNKALLMAYIDNRSAAVAATRFTATSIVPLAMLTAMTWSQDAKELSDDQQQQLAEANVANSELVRLYQAGKFAETAEAVERVLNIRKAVLGERHPDYAQSLNNLAVIFQSMGDYARVEPLYKQAIKIEKSVLGDNHPSYAGSLNNLAFLYYRMGNYARAEPLYKETLEIQKSVFGEKHPAYALSLNNLGLLYNSMGNYARAELLYKQAKEIRKSVLGEKHPDYAQSLNNLAGVYVSLGDYATAEPLYKQAKEIRKSVLGEKHPDYAQSLNNLAGVYVSLGDYARAEPLYKQTIEIDRSVFGEKHPTYAQSLNNLGGLYDAMGDPARAEPLLKQAMEIRRLVLGEKHPEYAASLSDLAGLYYSMGDYARAEPLSKQSLAIRKSELGEKHPDYATSLNGLAVLYQSMGDYARVESLYKQAMEIRKSVLGEKHPDYATSLNNLAGLYYSMGEYARAVPLYKQAMEIRKSVLGEKRPDYARSLKNLARLYYKMGDYAHAEPLYRQAIEIEKSVLGEKHREYAVSLNNLAGVYFSMGDYPRAEPLVRQAAGIVRMKLDDNSLVQSERQQKLNQSIMRFFLDQRLRIALRSGAPPSEVLQTIWQWKGAVTFRQQAYRWVATNPKLAPIFESLQSVSRQLSAVSGRSPVPPPTAAAKAARENYQHKRKLWEEQFNSLNQQREDLEQQIAADSAEFRELREPLTVAAVQKLLPASTAFVDFLDYNHFTPDPEKQGETNDERRFIAFVVRPDREPAMIGLGAVGSLSDAITAFRRPIVGERETRVVRQASAAAAERLRTLLWNPIEKHLDGIDAIVISPDTALGTLPFAALPGSKPGSFLIEDYALASLPMAQLLPRLLRTDSTSPNGGLLVLGDVDYGAPSGLDETDTTNPKLLAFNYERGRFAATREGNSRQWESLAGFRDELQSVKSLHQSRFGSDSPIVMLSGANATKNSFLKLSTQARTLHVITHGYFEAPSVKSIDQIAITADDASGSGPDPFINTWMPGLLSGLVMAGANNPSQDRDGILRASEIEAASMVGVDLVVLSACETGLGAVAGGEGLTGLQRAFHIAGARSVIASLWKVDDRATQELMRRFYTNLWLKEMSKIDALREAQLWMLNHPDELAAMGVQDARTRGTVTERKPLPPAKKPNGRTSPYFWAAFSLSGDWR